MATIAEARGALARTLHRLGEYVLPPVCLSCREPIARHDALCAACWRGIDFIRAPLCDRLGLPMPYDTGGPMLSAAAMASPPAYDRARAVARYDGVIRQLLHKFKYGDRHDARRLFGRWLEQASAPLRADLDLIVPVPLHRWRLLSRRYNQAAILSGELARLTGVRHDPKLLVRRRRTPSQVGLTHDQRRRNVAGAFALRTRPSRPVDDLRILLVDDVITTGATVEACARVLRAAGAARVDVVALAMVTDAVLVGT